MTISSNIGYIFPVDTSINENDHLTVGGCDTIELAKKYGTPLYIIDETTFRYKSNEYITCLRKYYPDFLVLYAAKAFSSTAIFNIANQTGLGLDIVSGGELHMALKANFKKGNIYFHGNNKTSEELDYFINNNAGKIVCDNFNELKIIQSKGETLNKTIEILIRLTPGIECHTHEYIQTGHLDSKFGFDLEYLGEVLNFLTNKGKNIKLKGFHAHIGSQIFEIKPFCDTINILLDQFLYCKEKYNLELSELNIGGGIGISYIKADDPILISDWAKEISSTIKEKCTSLNLKLPKLICEPGRSLIGTSGITIYKVGSIKKVPNGRKFISVDGGMADNPRPITYQAKYSAVIANKMNNKNSTKKEKVTIAGRYCETGDLLIKDIDLAEVEIGDYVALLNTGAYNYSMSSNYNMVPRPACVLVSNGKAEIIIERENYEDLTAKHKIPSRLLNH